MIVTRAKLAKGMSYPTNSSTLAEALDAAGITLSASLDYHHAGRFLHAYFWPPNPNVPYERLYMQVGSVPTVRARLARRYFQLSVLPSLIHWVQNILGRPQDGPIRREQQLFARSLPDDLSPYADEPESVGFREASKSG
jgi:hypothetical protein